MRRKIVIDGEVRAEVSAEQLVKEAMIRPADPTFETIMVRPEGWDPAAPRPEVKTLRGPGLTARPEGAAELITKKPVVATKWCTPVGSRYGDGVLVVALIGAACFLSSACLATFAYWEYGGFVSCVVGLTLAFVIGVFALITWAYAGHVAKYGTHNALKETLKKMTFEGL